MDGKLVWQFPRPIAKIQKVVIKLSRFLLRHLHEILAYLQEALSTFCREATKDGLS